MENQFSRTEILLGTDAVNKLKKATVAVFGVGGVGGYVCEALVRSGVEHFVLVDNDTVSLTNINRQIIATHSTIGKRKVDVMKARMLDINPNAVIDIKHCFFLPESANKFDFSSYDYVVDAVDTVAAKIELAIKCQENNVAIISSMGAGNKMDPTAFKVADINKTTTDPLARVVRRELRNRGIKKLKVVYSEEKPVKPIMQTGEVTKKREVPGSTAFVPSVVGLIIASEVIKDLIK